MPYRGPEDYSISGSAHAVNYGETETVSERLILCRSQGGCDKERAIRSKAEQRLLDDLWKLSSSVRDGNLKAHDKIQRRIGRIRQRHPRVARYYDIEFEQPKDKAQCGIIKMLESIGDNRQWDTIRQILRTHCYATIILPTSNGSARHIRFNSARSHATFHRHTVANLPPLTPFPMHRPAYALAIPATPINLSAYPHELTRKIKKQGELADEQAYPVPYLHFRIGIRRTSGQGFGSDFRRHFGCLPAPGLRQPGRLRNSGDHRPGGGLR